MSLNELQYAIYKIDIKQLLYPKSNFQKRTFAI